VLENVEFLGHAAFKVKGSKVVVIDPYQLEREETADIILITHSHFDHCSPDDVKKVSGEKTTIVASNDCADQLKGLAGRFIGLAPGQKADVQGVCVEAVPAYNINKTFHPRVNNWNGYLFTLDGVRYYHPGDTDKIPEMQSIKADVVFLPVGGTYTMDSREAAEVVSIIKPKAAVPMHYGTVIGSDKDARAFIGLVGERGMLLSPQKLS